MLRIYGIKNCDTMKKAFDWLKAKKISYEFHDYKTEGLSEEKVQEWLKKSTPELVANTRSTTWKALTDEQKSTLNNPAKLSKVLTENTSAVKRPLIEYKNEILTGFDATLWETKLK